MSNIQNLPVAIIGAGPVGLAAAVHLLSRGLTPILFEAGAQVGSGMRRWGHVRMFSPWQYNVDPASAALLIRQGWQAPDPQAFPTGDELVRRYLEPLAALPELARSLRLEARVTAVTRHGRDRMQNESRAQSAFVVRYSQNGVEQELLTRAVIDASGTLDTPNPLGSSGIPVLGESAAQAQICYGLPDVVGRDRPRYAGKRVLVVGSGHSAFNALVDLARLAREVPSTEVHWAVRRSSLARVLGGGEKDQLQERGALGLRIAQLVSQRRIELHAGFRAERLRRDAQGVQVIAADGRELPEVDELIVATGFRPDYRMLDELRLDLDPGTQAPSVLAPLIDPNLHSCGTVRPHGALELKHPDPDLYVVGMKSYGRAPTFLLLTGYEQVRSVAAALAGDWEAARRVELSLPETGVCSVQFGSAAPDETGAALAAGCCGGPAVEADSCCMADSQAKAAGAAGCGCSTPAALPQAIELPSPLVAASGCGGRTGSQSCAS